MGSGYVAVGQKAVEQNFYPTHPPGGSGGGGEQQSPAPFAETPIRNDSCLDYKSQNVRRFFFLIYGILLKTKFVGTNCGSAKPITLWRQPILITAITTNAKAKGTATKSQKKSSRNSNNNGKSES